ncbi:MAG TPA: 5-(carboxyamino)imidazole ribonucleotide synthase [Deinococcales bacterium]|nr:5-(carboxyamino)imidazole ribonucleotide synthase [Deinococcales bacterium]
MVVPPGGTIGILGGGQLARMLALAARPLGYRVVVLDPDPACPAAGPSDRVIAAPYDDPTGLASLADAADVVTLEFENVPGDALARLEERLPVRPGRRVLETARDRRAEKGFLQSCGVPVAAWAPVEDEAGLAAALERVALPGILKTATLGYDGKGQARVGSAGELRDAWRALGERPCVLEAVVPFEREVSVIVARSAGGEEAAYPPFENEHSGGILDLTTWPAALNERTANEATAAALAAARALDLAGLLCVEFFVLPDGGILANEMAPRPHNSGHLSIEAAATSQFEQAVRAACGLPLGPVTPRSPAAMANLLGDLWEGGEPDWTPALATPGAHLHLYGKREARPGRKMGHLTVLAATLEEARRSAIAARAACTKK